MKSVSSIVRSGALLLWACGLVAVGYGWLNAAEGIWTQVQLGLGGLAFGAVGLLLTLRASVPMGWLFLGAQVLMGLSLALPELTFGLLVLLAAVLLLFPSGRIPSRKWLSAVVLLAVATFFWLAEEVFLVIENQNVSWAVYFVSSTTVLVAASARIIADYRRAVGQTRQQLKWLAWVLGIGFLLLLSSAVGGTIIRDANQLAGVVLFVGGPIAIGLAITRYRLYEIDRIISRTVSYALIIAILVGGVALVSAIVGSRFDSPPMVAASTLGVAAAFNPLRRRVQTAVDRRFNRAKYDHERIAQQFTATLRDDVDMEGLARGWVGVVSETMQPTVIGLWMRVS